MKSYEKVIHSNFTLAAQYRCIFSSGLFASFSSVTKKQKNNSYNLITTIWCEFPYFDLEDIQSVKPFQHTTNTHWLSLYLFTYSWSFSINFRKTAGKGRGIWMHVSGLVNDFSACYFKRKTFECNDLFNIWNDFPFRLTSSNLSCFSSHWIFCKMWMFIRVSFWPKKHADTDATRLSVSVHKWYSVSLAYLTHMIANLHVSGVRVKQKLTLRV